MAVYTWTTTSGSTFAINSGTNCTSTVFVPGSSRWMYSQPPPDDIEIEKDWTGKIKLPDGSVIEVDNGNYVVKDDQAKIIYRANRNRAFNRYINGSDLLEEFLLFLGALGITQSQVFNVPIEVFINWLIMRAAQFDGEEVPDDVLVENHPKLLPLLPGVVDDDVELVAA